MKSALLSDETVGDATNAPFNFVQQLLPFRFIESCAFCGNHFEISRHRGRPQKFCSEPCRLSRLNEQKRSWADANSGSAEFLENDQ